jgi:hypothetical protein
MWNFLVNTLSIAYVQLVILGLFIWYFLMHRKDPRMPLSRVGLIRMIILLLIFLYFLMSWASGIRPALAEAAVFGMFIINLFFLNSLILSRLERPYREALDTYCQDPQNMENLAAVWSTGKRFYYLRHAISSLMSGESPARFLHEIASGRIRDDVQDSLRQRGLTHHFISLKGMIAYLEGRLAAEEFLPPEFKDVVKKQLENLQQHPWVVDQINAYLELAMENPEKIHNPEWSMMWEKTRSAK